MKKSTPSLFLLAFLHTTTLLVSADAGPAFNCDSPKMTAQEKAGLVKELTDEDFGGSDDIEKYIDSEYDANNKVRGTCKYVERKTTITLDDDLKGNFFLGSHGPVGFGCYKGSCEKYSKYSEIVALTSSSTLSSSHSSNVNEIPYEYAVFDKKFFMEKLFNANKNTKSNFSLSNFNTININIFQNEDDFKKGDYEAYSDEVDKSPQFDTLYDHGNYGINPRDYKIYTYNYREYGKHIYAPKGELLESQYAEVDVPIKLLSNEDLGITNGVISLTNPLVSINNYWLYTKKNGKITLSWQKTEYTLDDNTVKTITKDDKNVTVAMIFGAKSQALQGGAVVSSTTTSPTHEVKPLKNHTKNEHTPLPMTEETSFFQKFINFIASLFD